MNTMGHENRDLVPLGAPFDTVRRGGYHKEQVNEHLERVDADLRILAADRDAAVARAAEMTKQLENQRAQIRTLEGELEKLAQPPTTVQNMSPRIQRMLRLAEEEADEIRARAEGEAADAVKRAEAEGGALRNRYQRLIAELEERRAQQDAEHKALMNKATSEAERMVREATERVARLEADGSARRQQVEDDFEIAMATRRNEAMATLAEQEAASKAEAERRVQLATAEANRRLQEATELAEHKVAEAEQRVAGLKHARTKIAGQLRDARSVLASAAEQLEPLPDEEPRSGQRQGPSSASTSSSSSPTPAPAAASRPQAREVAANRR